MAEPVLVGLLFADRVITENNGKKGIIGTFTRFHSPKFPVSFPPWFIYAAATNLAPGKHTFALNLVRDSANQVIVPVSGEFEIKESSDVIELAPAIVGAVFPEAGKYTLAFYVDGEYVGARTLEIRFVEKPPAP